METTTETNVANVNYDEKFSGLTDQITKLTEVITQMTATSNEDKPDESVSLVKELDGKNIEEKLTALTSTIDLLASRVNGIVTEREAEKKAAEMIALNAREQVIDQIVALMPEYAEKRNELRGVPTSILQLMVDHQTKKTDDPKAPKEPMRRLTREEALAEVNRRRSTTNDKLKSLSTFRY